jgi:hypothetical protein
VLRLLIAGSILVTLAVSAPAPVAMRIENSGVAEYVEIRSSAGADLRGWVLVSVKGGQKLVLGAATVPATGTIRIVSGVTPGLAGDILWTRRNVWNNDGDIGLLYDGAGNLVAEQSYGRVPLTSPAKASSAKGTKASR